MNDRGAKLSLAHEYFSTGRRDQARAVLLKLLKQDPLDPDANASMCCLLAEQHENVQAEFYARRSLARRPDEPGFMINLANVLAVTGRTAEAITLMRRAVGIAPDMVQGLLTLANALCLDYAYGEALPHAERAAALAPQNPDAWRTLALVLRSMGHAPEAAGALQRGLMADPNDPGLLSGLCYTLNYFEAPAEAVINTHRAFGGLVHALLARRLAPFTPPRPSDGARVIRLGILSNDLRRHSVAYFLEPFLEHYDRASFHVTAYSTNPNQDVVTKRLSTLVDAWRGVKSMEEYALANLIRSDRIDVLMECTGHTGGTALGTVSLKPAPVQVSYCGYPNTTGLDEVDWRVVDSLTDPAGAEPSAVERLARLDPCFLCYRPPEDPPLPAAEPPSTKAGYVTFGSFNALQKFSETTVRLWARTVSAVPGARLLIKTAGMSDEGTRRDLTSRFAQAGLSEDRIEVAAPTAGLNEHLALYGRIDVALDTTPYNGTTTTCEALYMGVPVVVLAGRVGVHASRVGVSLLTVVGHPELIASSEDEAVRLAASLATDVARLTRFRASLRSSVESSPLCDRAGFAARMGGLIRQMWQDYVRGGAHGGVRAG